MKKIAFLCTIVLLLWSCGEAKKKSDEQSETATMEKKAPSLKEDLITLTNWFEGEFNNDAGIKDSTVALIKTLEGMKTIPLTVIHKRLDLPEFGDHVFYVQEYTDRDTSKSYRQRFVKFYVEESSNSIRMEQGFFKYKDSVFDGHKDLSKFDNLKREEVYFMQDLDPDGQCDIFWKRDGEVFKGGMPVKGCRHVGKEGERDRYYIHDMTLSENEYWRVDSSFYFDDDKLHVGAAADDPVKMVRQ